MRHTPCPCGAGFIHVDLCTPDHGWGGGHWYEGSIDCGLCEREYALDQRYPTDVPRLVTAVDMKRRENYLAEWHEKSRALKSDPQTQQILSRFATRIDQEKSVAAKYRFLRATGLVNGTEGTFRRHFAGATNFANQLSASALTNVLRAINEENSDLTARVDELEKLWKNAHVELPIVATSTTD